MNALDKLKKFFGRKQTADKIKAKQAFASRYDSFKELLKSNAALAGILTRLEAVQRGELTMETSQVRKEARQAIVEAERMAICLNDLSRQKHADLISVSQALGKRIESELEQHTSGDITSLTLSLDEIDASLTYCVGGKSANLGEMRNMGIPVPDGFAVTIQAGILHLLRTGGLFKQIHAILRSVDPENATSITDASAKVQKLIEDATIPEDVAHALTRSWDSIFGHKETVAALRSSAIAEDGVQSFAGQYLSILGVTRKTLLPSFKKIVASLFSPEALTYRASHGYTLASSGMGMCCLEMVKAKAAGVAFSRHPVDLHSNTLLINGVWGLGEMVVDGSGHADQWLVSRSTGKIVSSHIARKEMRLVLHFDGTSVQNIKEPVPSELVNQPCLTEAQIEEIARIALELERHYSYPQDLEWAVNEKDQIVLLQTRPMGLDSAAFDKNAPALEHLQPLFAKGDVAAKGVACGKIVAIADGKSFDAFPQGGIMLLKHSSPTAMKALPKAGAVIAETGSLTGHMASLCREFGVPTVMNLHGVFEGLHNDQLVTVDALSGRIFAGEVPELLSLTIKKERMPADSPARMLLLRIAPLILPLHLIDPESALFQAANCTSLHDVMRYAHEYSYSAMFLLSDHLSEDSEAGAAVRLVCSVPLDLYIIDLGGGLATTNASSVTPEQVTSAPFRFLLDGMLDPAVQAKGPRPVNMRGFLSVMGQSMIGGNRHGGERFGDRSYAILSDRYLNFSSRVGYHYAILDTWCGETLNKNYIRFEFAGGAAGNVQRERRVRCIASILSALDFTVQTTGDRLQARYQKYPKEEIRKRLTQLGRLLIMTRQMDMLMVNEASVQIYAENFLQGRYH